MSDKGRWFRIYPRQVGEHDKFRDLTAVELGAWTALRCEAELRDQATIRDRAEAVLILRRRKVTRPAATLDRLVALRLFDVDDAGRIAVHDRSDHDQEEHSPEQRSHRRDHRRVEPEPGCEWCVTEKWDRSASPHGAWVARGVDVGGNVDSPHSVDVDSPSKQPQPQPTAPATDAESTGLPSEADSATAACRLFVNGGRWLGDSEYVTAWDELDRSYSPEWVKPAIQPAFTDLHARNPKVKPWDLLRAVELRCAERARSEEREREHAAADAARAEAHRLREKAESASEEEKERASIVRRAIGLWIKKRPKEPVPTDFDELREWLTQNGAQA
jgi:hypothetical protein